MKKIFIHKKRPVEDWNKRNANDYDWDGLDDYEAEDAKSVEVVEETVEMHEEAESVETVEETVEMHEEVESVEAVEETVEMHEEAESVETVEETVEKYEEAETVEVVEESDESYAEDGVVYADEDFEHHAEDGAEYYEEDSAEYSGEDGVEYFGEDGTEYYEEDGAGYYEEDSAEYSGEDGAGYYTENSVEYSGEDGTKYYAEDGTKYYAEDGTEYYAEDGTEYYAEDSAEYFAEDGTEYSGENGTGYYAEDDVEYYAEDDTEYYIDESDDYKVGASLWTKFIKMGSMDRIITVTGLAVLILALVLGGVYFGNRTIAAQMEELADVGNQLIGIDLIGEKGLMAVADAEMARKEAAEVIVEEETEEPKEYDEEDYSNAVSVKLSMTSVKKDLKIKFTNRETGKLVPNVPFSVTITKPDGRSETWSDDDMDGIIYKKDITAGTYEVLVNELPNEKYKDYTIPSGAQSVEVKKDIAYEKIDVSDEVKTESEIDVAKEDTKKNDTVVESTLQDTVTWVESTSVAETYTEISKIMIPDPATIASTKSFTRTAAIVPAVSGGDTGNTGANSEKNVAFKVTMDSATVSLAIGDTAAAKVTASEYTQGKVLKYSVTSNNESVATAAIDETGNIVITGVAAGTATLTATVDYADGTSMPASVDLKVAVMDKPIVTLDKTTAATFVEGTVVVNAKVINAVTNAAVTAESSNTAVATVTVADKVVTITGVAVGDATITVKYIENGQETTATCVVKVNPHPKNNTTDKLKDLNGDQLYVQENEIYREAVYADYYTAEKFFIKGEVKYTGWQTIDGSVYYFNAAGEKVTGEQIIQGAKYNFASDGSLITGSGTLGIDVSRWNGNIDWNAVKNSGVSYVIIRCGYRGSTEGMLVEDPKFTSNIKGAINAGLKVGVYFFTQATDEIEAVEEASYVLDKIKNYKISYPVFLDVEPSGGRADNLDKQTRTAICKAFCETIQRGGYTAGIYANKTWLNEKLDTSALSSYKIWLAQYAVNPTYTGRYDMWQYKSTGKISGISTDVDMNLSYLGY